MHQVELETALSQGVLEHLTSIINSQSRLRNVKSGWEAYTHPIPGLQREQCGRKNVRVGNSRVQRPEARGKAGDKPKNSEVFLQGVQCEPSGISKASKGNTAGQILH